MEQQMREELIRSNLSLLQDDSRSRLVDALRGAGVNVANAYILNWIPEQAEDIYVVLVSANGVATVEVPRGDGEVLVEREELANFEGRCSKNLRLKIAVAHEILTTGRAQETDRG